jgi:hypothetical protein
VGRQASSAFLPIPGPNGPHGSKFTHILERRYEASQAAQPGQPVLNLFPNPDLSAVGPYPLCGKCHDFEVDSGEHQLQRACAAHQGGFLVLGVSHVAWDRQLLRYYFRRAAGEL